MATYRQIHVKLWADEKIEELSPLAMLTFIYLFSNSHRNEAAIYHLTVKKISNETNQTPDQVKTSLVELTACGRVEYDAENSIVWVVNALRYQSVGPKGIVAIKKDLAGIKSTLVEAFNTYYKDILYPIDTHPDKGKDKGKDNVKGKKTPPKPPKGETPEYKTFTDWFNSEFGTKYKPPTYKDKINTRLKNYTLEQLKEACVKMKDNPHMMGDNDSKKIYATLEYITRNDTNIDKWLQGGKPDGGNQRHNGKNKAGFRPSEVDWDNEPPGL